MKKNLFTWLFVTFLALSVQAENAFKEPITQLGPRQQEFRLKATTGDYQGMRNIAHSYLAPFKGEVGSKIGACAWYLLIPSVHKQRFISSDIGNIAVSCGKLDPESLATAYEYAFRALAK